MHTDAITMLSKEDCNFSYRDSIFKHHPHRYVILRVLFHFDNCSCDVPNYPGVQEHMTGAPNAQAIRNAIIATRQSKLPDWNTEYNVGSFFKNPEVSKEFVENLRFTFPDMVWFDVGDDRAKISAGWLIEHAGLKGFKKGNFKTYEKHALVIIHSGMGTYDELQDFISIITSQVQEKFGVLLQQEPITI
jgi:UDP-N-acetylmuramate dehydrogenase